MPCNSCPPGTVCKKNSDGKSWCQSTKTRKITKQELNQQEKKRLFGNAKRTGMRVFTNFLGKGRHLASNPDKKKKKKLKRTEEFIKNTGTNRKAGGEAGYKLKF